MKIKLKADKKYSICSCGLSKTLPFCDNSHREYNAINNTEYKSVKIIPNCDIELDVTSNRWKLNKEE